MRFELHPILLTPAETLTKMQTLVAQIALFEKHIKQDSLLQDVLPTVYKIMRNGTEVIPFVNYAKKCMISMSVAM
ncbi:ornithine decarboxylase [Rodentibacter pneumotropicus]|uniref:Ornithine decarboxylase n=1 Tax=Rodentibacter pneumotropicus TaxID=758 RepID=A0A448MIY5_9PAST|nr:ornithine decarboxylase [Rodentibacter pneumotropicus]